MKLLFATLSFIISCSTLAALERVTLLPNGMEQDGFLLHQNITDDGGFVAFTTTESDFSPDDRGFYDVYGWVRSTKTFELLSRDESG